MNAIGVGPESERNLRKLACYLLNLKESPLLRATFEMAIYSDSQHTHSCATTCGSVGCAVGHAPYAGIEKRAYEEWPAYSNRVFFDNKRTTAYPFLMTAWNWCFGSCWSAVDNTPRGAALRILWMLENGVPDNASSQWSGHAELCYANWIPAEPCTRAVDIVCGPNTLDHVSAV